MSRSSKSIGIIILLNSIFSIACEKMELTPSLEFRQYTESPDSVFIRDSRIYQDTTYSKDSSIIYLLKYNNPILEENIADPSVIRGENGVFYLFSTESGSHPNVPIYKSIDLVNWYFVDTAFSNDTRPKAFDGNIWAPDINYIDGKYVLYYSMSRWGGELDCGIGVAISDHPYGPFTDYAKLFDSREIGVQNSIDPFFIDNKDGKFLFWGSHHGIYGIQLTHDGLSIAKDAKKFQIAGNGGEGTYIHNRDGYYYLFISTGTCCNGLSSTYKIMMGRSEALEGPYYDQQGRTLLESQGSVFLQANHLVVGPGHNSEFITDDDGNDWLLYHGYLRERSEINRILFLDKVYWDHGWPHIPDHTPSSSSEIPVFKNRTQKETLMLRIKRGLHSLFHRD